MCGAVRFEVRGPLRDVLLCHCSVCRRWAGHAWAASAALREDLVFSEDRGLRWIDSPDSEYDARRGFCRECGSSLFYQVPGRDRISISAGALDPPTGIAMAANVYVDSAGDYYEVDDRLRSFARGADDALAAVPSEG